MLPTTRSGRRMLAGLLVPLLLAGSAGAAPALPNLGDASESVLSRADEKKLGEQAMKQLRAGGAYLDDPEVNAYVNRLGRRLLAADATIDGRFEFFVVPSAEINAFALPGGHIGINSGLIVLSENESELASVLAHEIVHVTQRHTARQIAGQANSQVATMAALLAAIIASRNSSPMANGVMTGAMAAQAQRELDYTRAHEHEADRIGFRLLVDAGFAPGAMASFFKRLQQATRLAETSLPAWLRSHPLTPLRIADAENRAQQEASPAVRDSADYRYVRALLRSYQREPEDAVAYFENAVADDAVNHVARYGLAAALLRAKKPDAARRQIETLDRAGVEHPMIESVAGLALHESGDLPAALRRYEAALARYPDHLQLIHDYPRALVAARAFAAAERFAEAQLMTRRGDATLHRIAAEADAALGRTVKSHYHLGEHYAALGDTGAAIEQLEIATRGEGEFRDLAIAQARLRELRAEREEALPPGRREGQGRGRPEREGAS